MIGEVSWLTTRTMNGLMVAGGDELQISMGSGHIRGGLGDHQSSPPGRLRLPGATRWLDFCGAFCSRSACQLCAWPPLAMEQLRWNQHFPFFLRIMEHFPVSAINYGRVGTDQRVVGVSRPELFEQWLSAGVLDEILSGLQRVEKHAAEEERSISDDGCENSSL